MFGSNDGKTIDSYENDIIHDILHDGIQDIIHIIHAPFAIHYIMRMYQLTYYG